MVKNAEGDVLVKIPRIASEYYYEDVYVDGVKESDTRPSLPLEYEASQEIKGFTSHRKPAFIIGAIMHLLGILFGALLVNELLSCNRKDEPNSVVEGCYDAEDVVYLILTAICGIVIPVLHFIMAGDLRKWNTKLIAVRQGVEAELLMRMKGTQEKLKALHGHVAEHNKHFVDVATVETAIPIAIVEAIKTITRLSAAVKQTREHRIIEFRKTLQSLLAQNREFKREFKIVIVNLLQAIQAQLTNLHQLLQITSRLQTADAKLAMQHRKVAITQHHIGDVTQKLYELLAIRPAQLAQMPAENLQQALQILESTIAEILAI